MEKIMAIVVLILLLASSVSIAGSDPTPIGTEDFSDDLFKYIDMNDFAPLISDGNGYSLPGLDMSSLSADYNGGFFAVDKNGRYIDTIDLSEFNSGVSGGLGMSGMSGEMGGTDTDDAGDDMYDPDDDSGQKVPDGVIGCSMDFIDFPPMTKGDICNKSEREILKEYDMASKVDPDSFHVYNPLAFKTFNILHPSSYPDNVDVIYNIEIKYTGEQDLELAMKDKWWVNVTPDNGDLLYNTSSPWWEPDAEKDEDQITVKINITEIPPGRHTACIIIHSYYYNVDRDLDYTGSPDYTYDTNIPVSVNIWPDPTNESSLKYSILGGESVYKYDIGRIRADDPFSLVVDVWNAGPETTTSFYTVEPDLMISGVHDYVLYSEVIRDFHRIINNVIVVEPCSLEERYVGPERFRASEGEHDYLRIKINVALWLRKMQGLNTDLIDQAWIRNCPTISISNLIKDVQNPTFAFKITSYSGESFWFEISYSAGWTGGSSPDLITTELDPYTPKAVPQGETLHLIDVIAWNPCPVDLIDNFDTAISYNFGSILASVDPDDPHINNPPPKDSWIEGDHVKIFPSRGVLEHGGSPGGDNFQNIKGRDIINFYVDTTGLQPGDYIVYTSWLAECDYWSRTPEDGAMVDPDTFMGFAGIGLAPALTPSKCIFTVKPADWTPEEPVDIQEVTPQTIALDNLDTIRNQDIGEILECVGNHNIIYQYGPEFPEINAKEFKIENNGDNTVVYGEVLPNVLVTDNSLMFDIYPKKPFDICPMPTDKIIIIPRSNDYKPPLSNDTDSSFEERGGNGGLYAPFIANPFDIYDQLAFINGQMTHIEPPPLYKNIKVQVLNPVNGEWIDIQDPHRRNPHTGDWVNQLEDVPVGTTLTYRIEVFIRDFRDGLDGCNSDIAGYGNLGWPIQIENILPENLAYEEDSAKTRLGAWWKMRDPMACGGGGEDLIDPDENNCFLQGTKILMEDKSYKNIEDIAVGDFVKSYDEQTKTIVDGRVNEIFKHDKEIMADYYLIINNDLRVTPDHPIYKDNGWIAADDLIVGDIIGFDGNFYEISSIEKIFEQVTTYNFEVEKYHNYMVRSQDSDILVHNGGSYHPEYEGEFYFSWAEKFTPFEPSIECNNLMWNLPTGKLIKIVEIPGVPWYRDCDFSLFDQPTCHPHAGSSPIWPYHPTATWAFSTTGAVAVEIVFNATITDKIDIDEIITNEANLKVLDFYDHYYSNQDIQQINNDAACITLKNSNLPPNKPEILSPFDGETGLSVKYTDELLVRVTDPDNDLMSVSFYWMDKPRFSICMDPRASEPGSDRPPMIDAPVATAYEYGCHGTRIETRYNVPSGSTVSFDPRPIAYFDEKLFAAGFDYANIKYLEYDTQYEWYVVVKDMKDTVRSDISSFSTDDKPPEADFTFMSEELHTGEVITFDASPSYDPDGVIFDYMWTYEPVGGFGIPGDNNIPDWYDNIDPIHGPGVIGSGETIEYLLSEPGEYEVKLHVCYTRYDSLTYSEHVYVPSFDRSRWPYYSTVTKIINVITEGTTENSEPTDNNPPIFLNVNPLNPSKIDMSTTSLTTLSVTIIDPDTDRFDWTIETSPNIGNASGKNDYESMKTCIITEELQLDRIYTWYVNATDPSGSGEYTREIYTFTTQNTENNGNNGDNGDFPAEEDNNGYTTCDIEITQPLKDYLYLGNEKKVPFFIPLIIGNIEVDATVTDPTKAVSNVKFFFDGEEKENFVFNPEESIYHCEFNEKAFFWKEIKVEAYDSWGNTIASEKIVVMIFSLGGQT